MFSALIKSDLDLFPKSFILLQQEAFLAKSCISSGLEFLIKGGFTDVYKGSYYSAFFQLSIGFERIMKLVAISDFMIKNNFTSVSPKDLRKMGHKLLNLYEKCKNISSNYFSKEIIFITENSLDYTILTFLDNFAHSTGRYYNIANISSSESSIDPIVSWKEIIDQIKREDFSEKLFNKIESKTFNSLIPALQIDDIAHSTGYVNEVYTFHLTNEANRFAVWHIMNIINPLVETLEAISMKCHEIQTTTAIKNYPSIPYYDEFFPFANLRKEDYLKRKTWINF